MAGPRFLSVVLMIKLSFFFRSLRALACIGVRLLRLIFQYLFRSLVCSFFSSFSKSVLVVCGEAVF
jgi:hypothetical protein